MSAKAHDAAARVSHLCGPTCSWFLHSDVNVQLGTQKPKPEVIHMNRYSIIQQKYMNLGACIMLPKAIRNVLIKEHASHGTTPSSSGRECGRILYRKVK